MHLLQTTPIPALDWSGLWMQLPLVAAMLLFMRHMLNGFLEERKRDDERFERLTQSLNDSFTEMNKIQARTALAMERLTMRVEQLYRLRDDDRRDDEEDRARRDRERRDYDNR